MTRRARRPFFSLALCGVLALVSGRASGQSGLPAAPDAAPVTAPESARRGAAPTSSALPVILPVPAAPSSADGTLTLQVRIQSEAGVGRVLLWARGEEGGEFQPFPMTGFEGGLFLVNLETWPNRGRSVRYYVEAWNADGTGPARAGNEETPFVATLAPASSTAKAARSRVPFWIGGLLLGMLLAFDLGWRLGRRRSPSVARTPVAETPAPRPRPVPRIASPNFVRERPVEPTPESPALAEAGGRRSRLAYPGLEDAGAL